MRSKLGTFSKSITADAMSVNMKSYTISMSSIVLKIAGDLALVRLNLNIISIHGKST